MNKLKGRLLLVLQNIHRQQVYFWLPSNWDQVHCEFHYFHKLPENFLSTDLAPSVHLKHPKESWSQATAETAKNHSDLCCSGSLARCLQASYSLISLGALILLFFPQVLKCKTLLNYLMVVGKQKLSLNIFSHFLPETQFQILLGFLAVEMSFSVIISLIMQQVLKDTTLDSNFIYMFLNIRSGSWHPCISETSEVFFWD